MSEPNPIVVASQNVVVQARPAPAFQANAFFNPGFQTTSHSLMAFQQCAFSHTAFQTDECRNDGRSGYWRLFFTQMQEEALKKDAERSTPRDNESTTAQETATAEKITPVKKASKKLPKLVPLETYDKPDFKRKKIFVAPTQVQETLAPWVVVSSSQIDTWISEVIPLWEQHKRAIIAQREAANDADYRLRLLLLAA